MKTKITLRDLIFMRIKFKRLEKFNSRQNLKFLNCEKQFQEKLANYFQGLGITKIPQFLQNIRVKFLHKNFLFNVVQPLSYYRYVIFQNKSIAAYMSNTLAKVFIFDNLKNKMCDARFI